MEIHLSQFVNAAIERVFEVFSDISQTESRIEGITKTEILSDVTSGVGTRWRDTRIMFGREIPEEKQISGFVPNQSYEIVAEGLGANIRTIYTFTPKAEGTQVDMVYSATAQTLAGKLMTPLGYLMKGVIRKSIQADMEALKQVCETPSR